MPSSHQMRHDALPDRLQGFDTHELFSFEVGPWEDGCHRVCTADGIVAGCFGIAIVVQIAIRLVLSCS
jgi:hypothetical protein